MPHGRGDGSRGCPLSRLPAQPPRRGDKPVQSRLGELDAVKVPTLVVQGESDPFGMPPPGKARQVSRVAGNHGLKSDLTAVSEAVRIWLAGLALRLDASEARISCLITAEGES